MIKILLTGCLLSLTGCATSRSVSLQQLRDYDQAINIAEKHHIDTTEMRKKLVEMILSYAKSPAKDEYAKAAHDAAEAMRINAAVNMYNATKPVPVYQPPMTPGEYKREMQQFLR